MSQRVVQAIQSRFGSKVISTHAQAGDHTVLLDRSVIPDVGRFLKTDASMAFDMPIDCTAVDYKGYPGHEGPRFMVIWHLYSTTQNHRIRLKVALEESDCTTPSLQPIWRGFDWFEREAWDMFGIRFDGHHDLRRILLYEEFVGHPLRKDYPIRGYQPLVPIAKLDPDNEDPKLVYQDLNPEAPRE
jgi:NADH-quinone oxidoreductase subunit C